MQDPNVTSPETTTQTARESRRFLLKRGVPRVYLTPDGTTTTNPLCAGLFDFDEAIALYHQQSGFEIELAARTVFRLVAEGTGQTLGDSLRPPAQRQ